MNNRFIQAICSKTDSFYKNAGLVKIPEQLLLDVQNFVIGSYLRKSSKFLEEKIRYQRTRITTKNYAHKILDNFSEALQTIDILLENRDYETFIQRILDKQIGIVIPYFNEYSTDDNSGLQGSIATVLDNKPAQLKMFLYAVSESTFNFNLEITRTDHPLIEGSNVIPTKISERSISVARILQIIKEQKTNIDEIYSAFSDCVLMQYQTYTDESINKLQIDYAKIKQLYNKIDLGYEDEHKNFTIPTSSISYFSDAGIKNINFNVEFVTRKISGPDEDNWIGRWKGTKQQKLENDMFLGTLQIYRNVQEDFKYGYRDSLLKEVILDLKDTTKHELIHFMQNAIGTIKQLPEWGGLPSKSIRDNQTDFHGQPVSQKQTNTDKTRIPHQLRDIEFYTRLSDTVLAFKRVATKFPLYLQPLVAKIWVRELPIERLDEIISNIDRSTDQDDIMFQGRQEVSRHGNVSFFEDLKSQQPLKYQKAVKEFYKAVQIQ